VTPVEEALAATCGANVYQELDGLKFVAADQINQFPNDFHVPMALNNEKARLSTG